MAYTTPSTAVTGVVAPASMWNSGVRDNFLAVMHPIVIKSADESVTSSTTIQDDNELILPVGVSEVWQFLFNLLIVGNTTGDIKFSYTQPAGAVTTMGVTYENAAAAAGYRAVLVNPSETDMANNTTQRVVPLGGVIVNSTNAGNLTLQWAQNTSDGTATTIRKYSTLWAARLA
jgi:hypothetical protein